MQEYLIMYCAPTLAGIKTASLFSYPLTTRQQLDEEVEAVNRSLNFKGVYCEVLRLSVKSALIYVYRPWQLEVDLSRKRTQQLLKKLGYPAFDRLTCLRVLKEHLHQQTDFPHEIGLFLGYPEEDVEGFIKHKGKNSKATGYWKVYGDVVKCLNIFKQFKACKEWYVSQFKSGANFLQLVASDEQL